jgi:hypothetical protein
LAPLNGLEEVRVVGDVIVDSSSRFAVAILRIAAEVDRLASFSLAKPIVSVSRLLSERFCGCFATSGLDNRGDAFGIFFHSLARWAYLRDEKGSV